jgi:hypothetical protein
MTGSEQGIRLLYYSKANIPGSADERAEEYSRILASARRNNALVDISGALMVSGNRFAQVLEGPLDAVMRTFEKIKRDERHRYVTILKMSKMDQRMFGSWAMGAVGSRAGEILPISAQDCLNSAITNPERGGDTLVDVLQALVEGTEMPNVSQIRLGHPVSG